MREGGSVRAFNLPTLLLLLLLDNQHHKPALQALDRQITRGRGVLADPRALTFSPTSNGMPESLSFVIQHSIIESRTVPLVCRERVPKRQTFQLICPWSS